MNLLPSIIVGLENSPQQNAAGPSPLDELVSYRQINELGAAAPPPQ